jgi:hypothetical protein
MIIDNRYKFEEDVSTERIGWDKQKPGKSKDFNRYLGFY